MENKRIIPTYIITLMLIFSLIGCSSSNKPVSSVTPASDETNKVPNAVTYKTYSNDRFGFSLSYPDVYVEKTESDNGDGISMESSDKLHTLKIWGGYNVNNSSGSDLLVMAKDRVSHINHDYADDHVYKLEYGGGDETPLIFNEFGYVDGDKVLCFLISYPEEEKGKYIDIVTHMSNELTKNTAEGLKTNAIDMKTGTKEPSQETPSTNQDVKKSDSREQAVPNKEEFTYSIIDDTYAETGITIKFPQLTKASNPTKADSINKSIQESIRSKLDSLRSGNEDLGAFTLDLNYEIVGYGNKVLSLSYQGYSHFEQTAYPVNVYHTQNIALEDVHTIPLKDLFTIDDFFVERFKLGMYSPREDLDLEKAGVKINEEILSEYSNKDLISLFQKAEANYKLTEYGVILSIEVPHAFGDHVEMAITYETIEINMIKGSPTWKDYLFINKR